MQGYSQEEVLESLLDAAVHWIRAGLPLKSLLICNFRKNSNLCQLFTRFKESLTSKSIIKVSNFIYIISSRNTFE